MATKKKAGRPTVMTKETLDKLEYAFLRGLSDRESCLYANIDPQTLYNYCNSHPDFSSRKELLKEQVKMKAKLVVADEIDAHNEKMATWYLERKAKDEFSTKTEIDNNVSQAVMFVEDVPREDDLA